MKKYFCVETDEEIKIGDVVCLTFSKDLENGSIVLEKKIMLDEDSIKNLLEMDILEERESSDDTINFTDGDCGIEELLIDFEVLEKRVENLESLVLPKRTTARAKSTNK